MPFNLEKDLVSAFADKHDPLVAKYAAIAQQRLEAWKLHALQFVIDPEAFKKLLYALKRWGAKAELHRYIDIDKLRIDFNEPGPRGTYLISLGSPNPQQKIHFKQVHTLYYGDTMISTLEVTWKADRFHYDEVDRIPEPLWQVAATPATDASPLHPGAGGDA